MRKKGIHIKEGNEGKFGAFARSVGMSVQEAARHVLANRDKYPGARVKQANFARNTAKWKKQDGGVVRSDDRWRMMDNSAAPIVDGVAPGGLLLQKRFIDDAMARMERSNFSGVVPSARMPTQAEIIEAQRKDAIIKEQAKALVAYQQQHATDYKKRVSRPQPVDNLAPNMGQQRFLEAQLNGAGSIPNSQGRVMDEDEQFEEALRVSRDAKKDAELARRARTTELADEVKDIDFFSSAKWTKENLAKAAQGLGERGRIFTDEVDGGLNWFDEHLNPLMQIGKWAKKMGEAPLDAQRTNSIVPYLTAIGTPLLYRALGSRPFEATIPFARNAIAAQTFNDHLRNIWQHGVVDSGKDLATDWVVDHAQAAIDKSLEPKRMGGGANGEWRMGNGVVGENTNNGSIFNSPFPIGGKRMARGGSIVDFLGRQGVDSSFGNRKQLFGEHFNEAYRGTADQNTRFLELLQSQSQAPQPEEVGSGQGIVGSGQLPVAGRQGDGAAEGEKFNPFFNTEEDRDAYEKRLGEVANRALWWGDDSDYLKYTSYHPKADGNDCINGICGLNLKAGLTYSHPTDEDRYLGNTKFTDNLHKGMEDYYQTYQPRVGTHLQKLDDKGIPFHSMLVYKIDRDDKGRPSKYHVIHNGGDTKFVEKVFSPEDMQEELHPSGRKDPYMIAWNPGKYLDRDKLAKERMGKAPFPYNQSEEEVQRYFGDTNLPTQFSLKDDSRGLTPDSPLYYLSGRDVKDQSRNELLGYLNDKELDKELRGRLRIDDVTLQNLKPYIFGIMGVESNDQNISAGRDIKERVAQLVKRDPSLGPFQIRLGSVGDRARKAFDINEQDDLSKDMRKGYIAAVDRMLEAKRVMDDRVAKGYHPELAKSDPYARAVYYYNQPQRALMSDEDYAKKNFVYQPFTIPNPAGKDWRFSTSFNASQDELKSAYEKFLEQSRLRGDRGSYMHQVMKAAYPLNMEVLDDEEPRFGVADASLPAVEVVGKRAKRRMGGEQMTDDRGQMTGGRRTIEQGTRNNRMKNGGMRDVHGPWTIDHGQNSQFSTGGYKAGSPDRFNEFNVIPSGRITMQGVPHPVVGMDNLGYRQVMMPGAEYRFPGQTVLEVPVRGRGQMTDDRWQMTGGSPAQVRQAGGPVDGTLTQPVDKTGAVPVDETAAQKEWYESYLKSKGYDKHLSDELEQDDVSAEKQARLQNLQNVPVKYSRDLGSWMQGAYMPREYKGMMFKQGWMPAGPQPDPIFGIETPGTLYLGRQFRPGQVPQAKFATTPVHEFSHVVDDGGFRIPNKTISKINDYTSKGDAPDWTQYNGRSFGYLNDPSEVIGRLQSVRYLLNKSNIHDARTEVFDDAAFDKMMNDPTIQNNSDFQELFQTLKGSDAEKKQRFMNLMNTVASRSNGEESTMARYGGMIERETERGRGRYQDGGVAYQAPEGYAPSTAEQRANWNQFLNYLESKGVAGSTDLDARDKRLGLQYLNEYNKAYPKTQVPEAFIPTAQYENYLIRRKNEFPGLTADEAKFAFANLPATYRERPISSVDNWIGANTSKELYPGYTRGKTVRSNDGTEAAENYNFGQSFEDYARSRSNAELERKYLTGTKGNMNIANKQGTQESTNELFNRMLQSYQLGGEEMAADRSGFVGAGNINPFGANPYFTQVYAPPAAPTVAATAAPYPNDTGLYPYGVINPFDTDPYMGGAGALGSGPAGMRPPNPAFKLQAYPGYNPAVGSVAGNAPKTTPNTISPTVIAAGTRPTSSPFNLQAYPGYNPVVGSVADMAPKTAPNTISSTVLAAGKPKTPPEKTPPKKTSQWGPNIDAATELVSDMAYLNSALEAKDRNSYRQRERIRNLGDNKGPLLPGNMEERRGDYTLNDGYFRPQRYVPTQFGVAQMGGFFSEARQDVPVMGAPELPVVPGFGSRGARGEEGELGMKNGVVGENTNNGRNGEEGIDLRGEGKDIATKTNNPGNIKWNKGLAQFDGYNSGIKGTDGGTFAGFPSIEAGLAAYQAQLFGDVDGIKESRFYKANTPVDKALRLWSNDGYGAEIFPEIKGKTLGELTQEERSELMKRQIKRESGAMYHMLKQENVFREGGEYTVSEDELRRILAMGGEVEYL